jgi:HTH-type transcriptional regulator / antitoxin HigA
MSYEEWKAGVLARPGAAQRVQELYEKIQAAQDLAALRRSKGITQRDAAKLMGVSQPRIAQIEKAENLTSEVIEKYAHVLGGHVRVIVEAVPSSPGDAQVSVGRGEKSNFKLMAELKRGFPPLREVMKRGWVQGAEPAELAASLAGFRSPVQNRQLAIAARKVDGPSAFTPTQEAWISRILQRAEPLTAGQYNPETLSKFASQLGTMEPSDLSKIPRELAKSGVIALMEEHLPGSKLDGIAVLRDDGTPIIGVTNRGKRFDVLLWTVLHELAHVWLGHLHAVPITIDEDLGSTDRTGRELEADERARAWLFPDPFVPVGSPSAPELQSLSRKYDVHPSIIAGQLLRTNPDDYKRLSKFLTYVQAGVW